MLNAAAEKLQTVRDETMRLQNGVAQGQKSPAGGMLMVQNQYHPRPALERDGLSTRLDNSSH